MSQGMTRRDFLKSAGTLTAMAAVGNWTGGAWASDQRLVTFPEKTELILLTSRPPNLEMPAKYFRELITPNKALFVRWHLANIPTTVDLKEWRLTVGGQVEKELQLPMAELRSGFERVTYTAVIQCAGNGRSFFEPRIPGAQWANGSMGNVTWTGARLKDVLRRAGLKQGAVEVSFDGLDTGTLPSIPDFVRTLPVDTALDEDVIIAYEMNGEPLSMLNGFPARLVVPGWYASYWIKSLSTITVWGKKFEGFWMDPAYRIPDNACACVPPGGKPARTTPITRMNTRSLILDPVPGRKVKKNKPVEIMGIAFSGGYSIKDVIVSVDGGKSWRPARLGKDLGRYSWIQWFYQWKPAKAGKYALMARATNSIGESQPFETLWNASGYRWNKVDPVEVTVA